MVESRKEKRRSPNGRKKESVLLGEVKFVRLLL